MKQLQKAAAYINNNALFILSAFLLVFIPLFPKIPLFDILPGYIVRARPEDLLVILTALIWIRDAVQKRFPIHSTYLWIVVAFTLSGIMSILLGTILLQTIPTQLLHIGKSALHLFRYLEYFALFFFLYSSVRTKQHLIIIFTLLTTTVLGVVLYGFGQEYLQFPLYSTMNREYSKGTTLYLQEGARPQSTFAGHYDLAAYLVIVLPILFSLALSLLQFSKQGIRETIKQKSTLLSFLVHGVHIIGAWMLVTSGSKTALLAYLVAIAIVLLQYLLKLGSFKQQLQWGSVAFVITLVVLSLFLHFFAPATRDKFVSLVATTLGGSTAITDPNALPDDLIGDGYVFKPVVTIGENGETITEWVPEKSTWSQNALKYGLSMGIRLDTLWPNALQGLASNPLFGKGYATLAVEHTGEFTYAESTDNNFLRTLGETGIIGFIIFYGFILLLALELIKQNKATETLARALQIGFLGSIVGILINATYIDVFASSKVAYTFWAFAGITVAALKLDTQKTMHKALTHIQKHWPIYLAIIISFFLLHKNPFNKNAPIRELAVSNTQIELLTTARCFLETGSLNICRPNGLVLSSNTNLYSILLIPFLQIYNNPMMFYILNITLFLFSLVVVYILAQRLLKNKKTTDTKQLLTFTALISYVLVATVLEYSNKPLTQLELLFFIVIVPTLLLGYTVILTQVTQKIRVPLAVIFPVGLLLVLYTNNFSTTFITQFRNNSLSKKQEAIEVLNIHFDMTRYLNRTSDFYVISAQNPYYVDFFSNKHYELVPLSSSQPYMDNVQNVYTATDINVTPETNVYLSDLGISANETYQSELFKLKQLYDLKYVAIGCDDSCNLLRLSPKTNTVSSEPKSVTTKQLSIQDLQKPYSFAVIANRYEPTQEVLTDTNTATQKPQYSTQLFAHTLNSAIQPTTNFVVVTGDIYHDNDVISDTSFQKSFTNKPVLYNPGNFELVKEKFHTTQDNYFYTDSEFFLFLNVSDDSTISSQQRLFLYNALLELEQLPKIKHIFIIAHNLNWQERSNPKNTIFDIEKKLLAFPDLDKYIVTSHKSNSDYFTNIFSTPGMQHSSNPDTNTTYLSSSMRNWETDTFFEFIVNTDDTVTINYKFKNKDF